MLEGERGARRDNPRGLHTRRRPCFHWVPNRGIIPTGNRMSFEVRAAVAPVVKPLPGRLDLRSTPNFPEETSHAYHAVSPRLSRHPCPRLPARGTVSSRSSLADEGSTPPQSRPGSTADETDFRFTAQRSSRVNLFSNLGPAASARRRKIVRLRHESKHLS